MTLRSWPASSSRDSMKQASEKVGSLSTASNLFSSVAKLYTTSPLSEARSFLSNEEETQKPNASAAQPKQEKAEVGSEEDRAKVEQPFAGGQDPRTETGGFNLYQLSDSISVYSVVNSPLNPCDMQFSYAFGQASFFLPYEGS